MVCKCIGGVGLGFIFSGTIVYGVECMPPRKRGVSLSPHQNQQDALYLNATLSCRLDSTLTNTRSYSLASSRSVSDLVVQLQQAYALARPIFRPTGRGRPQSLAKFLSLWSWVGASCFSQSRHAGSWSETKKRRRSEHCLDSWVKIPSPTL